MSGYDKQLISIILYSQRLKFYPFQDFQGPQPEFKDFPRAWNFLLPIPRLSSGIFKDRGFKPWN